MNAMPARITQGGRLVIPAAMRKAMQINEGDVVMLQMVGNALQVRTVADQIEAVQAFCAPLLEDHAVDEFLAERRREAAKELD